jgi:hypothetical protein
MMLEALEPTPEPGWVLSHEGYNVLTESAVESRFAFSNGFLSMRAARPVSRGRTWVGWLGYSRWASWPRCYVAGLRGDGDADCSCLAEPDGRRDGAGVGVGDRSSPFLPVLSTRLNFSTTARIWW